jgi:very-short-patch-repair endonuclease
MPAGAYFSHTTAAELLGVPLPPEAVSGQLHVSVPAPRTAPRGRGILGHSLGSIAGSCVEGLPVSDPAHVWCQLAAELRPDDLVAAGDHLLGARRRPASVSVDQLAEVAARMPRSKGGRARAWALPRIRFGADSRPESLLRLFLERLGWEDLEVNEPVPVDGGRMILHPDLSLRAEQIAVEYEGDGHRVDRRQWSLDIRRQELLQDAGWRVVRITAAELFHDREALATRLRRFAPNLGSGGGNTEIWRKS